MFFLGHPVLSDYFLTTFWLHSDYILTTCWQHADYMLNTFWLHSDYILTTVWLHSDYILTTFWLHSYSILIIFDWPTDWLGGWGWGWVIKNFGSIVQDEHYSKKINRPKMIDWYGAIIHPQMILFFNNKCNMRWMLSFSSLNVEDGSNRFSVPLAMIFPVSANCWSRCKKSDQLFTLTILLTN